MRTERVDYIAEFATAVYKYMDAVATKKYEEEYFAGRIVAVLHMGEPVYPTDLERLTLFLLPLPPTVIRNGLLNLLLAHHNITATALTAACRSEHYWYRILATQHPSCPDEDSVYVALKDDLPSEISS